MKKKVLIWEITGFLVVCALSGVFHFIYDWSGKQTWIGFFCPVNESTWEHLKLIFWPLLIFGAGEYLIYGRKICGFICAKTKSILIGMFIIVAGFYTYTGIWGKNTLILDIGLFFAAVVSSYVFMYRFVNKENRKCTSSFYSVCCIALLAAIALLFIIFTYDTPRIALFQDPVTKLYGI